MNVRTAIAGPVIIAGALMLSGCCGPCLVPCIPGVWPRPSPPLEIPDVPAKLVSALINQSLGWRRTARGPEPFFPNPVDRDRIVPKIESLGTEATSLLIAMLDDPDRFAVAHVLLTRRAGQSVQQTSTSWNGMSVEITREGGGIVHPEERAKLKAFWSSPKTSLSQ
jgi:hypothetical protein